MNHAIGIQAIGELIGLTDLGYVWSDDDISIDGYKDALQAIRRIISICQCILLRNGEFHASCVLQELYDTINEETHRVIMRGR